MCSPSFLLQNSSVEVKTEQLVNAIATEVNVRCQMQCGLTRQQFRNSGFRCGTNDDIIVFRTELLSTSQSSAMDLRDHIVTWASFANEVLVVNVYLKLESTCMVAIDSLRDPPCSEGGLPTTAGIGGTEPTAAADTGSATAGWVIAVLAIVAVIVLSIAVVVVGFLYLRARNKQEYTVT